MENNVRKTDRRVVKTKRAIRNALAQIMSEKNINDITVKEVAQLADINRKTFYNYYSGVHQVVEEIENEIIDSFELALKDTDFRRDIKNPSIIFDKLNSIISKDLDFYEHILCIKGNHSLISKITGVLKEKMKNAFAKEFDIDSQSLEIMADYTVSGMCSVYQSWVKSHRSFPMEEMSGVISVVCFSGINGILQEYEK
ncbi:MAG: TetR/AcrR family transcriptional regulator [Ruminococcus sp.]